MGMFRKLHRFQKVVFTVNGTEESFLVPKRTKCEEHFNNLKKLLCNGKPPWMLKVLHGNIVFFILSFYILEENSGTKLTFGLIKHW